MIDSAHSVFQGMVNQIEFPYDEPDGTVVATDEPRDRGRVQRRRRARHPELGVRRAVERRLERLDGQRRVRHRCCAPAWMLGIIEGNAPDVTGWEVANAFPNGGGNWGGSYLTVPANGKNVEAALALADWLTSAANAGEDLRERGQYPSVIEAQSSPAITDSTNAYFNDAPTGTIFGERCRGGHGQHLQERRLLQVQPGAPGCHHPGLRRPRRPADRVGHLRGRGRSLLID